jgi:hypothetical protein
MPYPSNWHPLWLTIPAISGHVTIRTTDYTIQNNVYSQIKCQSHTMVQGAEKELFWLKIQYSLLFSIHAFICIYFSVTTSINALSVTLVEAAVCACPVSLLCWQFPWFVPPFWLSHVLSYSFSNLLSVHLACIQFVAFWYTQWFSEMQPSM